MRSAISQNIPETTFPIVGIVAPGDGEELARLLEGLPAHDSMAVVVSHAAPALERLHGNTRMPVVRASHGLPLQPGYIYVGPPEAGVVLAGQALELLPPRQPMPQDSFWRSLARHCPNRAIGIVLGGVGGDGVLGLHALRSAGGVTLADRPLGRAVPADFVLPAAEIAGRLPELASRLHAGRPDPGAEEVGTILALIRETGGPDLAAYQEAGLHRHIHRRMLIAGVEYWDEYIRLLTGSPPERQALCRDIRARAARFFPDPEVFATLSAEVFPEMFLRLGGRRPVRIWVPGCATGEEAYSVAFAALRVFGPDAADVPLQIFATDPQPDALRIARAGAYPEGIVLDVPPGDLERFFVRAEGGYQVALRFRELCVFAHQDLLADPPLARLDLIYCGYALSGWRTGCRERARDRLYFALGAGGYLVSRDPAAAEALAPRFVPLNGRPGTFARQPISPLSPPSGAASEAHRLRSLRRQAESLIGERSEDRGILVDEQLRILYSHGPLGPYLESPPEAVRPLLLEVVHPDLRPALGSALTRARDRLTPVRATGLPVRVDGRCRRLDLEILPLLSAAPGGPGFLVLLRTARRSSRPAASPLGREVLRLQKELTATRDYLRSLSEEQDSTNEELRATNLELLAGNEELLRANQELEIAQQDLQRANDRLRDRNAELVVLSDDLHNLFASVDIALVIFGRDLTLRRFNPVASRLLGLRSADLGRPLGDLRFPLPAAELEPCVREVIVSDSPNQREIADRDRWYSLRLRPYRTADRTLDGAVLAWVDITDLKQAQQALESSEARYRIVSEIASDYAYALRLEPDGRQVREWTTAALARITGYRAPEIDALGWESLVHPDDQEAWRTWFQGVLAGRAGVHEYRFRNKAGDLRWLREYARAASGGPQDALRVYGAAQDITALRQSEEQLRQAQKMEAVGRLAGGVAHDFNNLLTAILGYAELLQEELPPGSPLRQDAEEITKASVRAAALTRRLLAFSRRQLLQPAVLDLNAAIRSLEPMLRRLIGEHIDVRTILDPRLGRIQADPSQIEQVILNLVVNAADAMPQGGRLTLVTANVDGAAASEGAREPLPGAWVLVAATDSGCGMDPSTLSHLFEPFFTTKEQGKGTGLGLSTVYGIVQQSGGHIRVDSRPGQGSTFRVYLPRLEDRAERVPARAAEPALPSGSETILLVEDFSTVRDLARSILSRHGYAVLEASDGSQALEIAAGLVQPPALLLTDVVMPGLSGCELAEQLRSRHPAVKVLFLSGYTDNVLSTIHLQPGSTFLAKPFTPDALLRQVREVLDSA